MPDRLAFALTDLLGEEAGGDIWSRFTVHYTPTHGSWLNQAEIEIGTLSQAMGWRQKNHAEPFRYFRVRSLPE
jgi:hypothetical protein